VVGLVAEPVNLDPAQVTDLNSNRVGRRVVETLVTFPEESTQIVPGLAESWTVSKDGLQYTFKLRKGVTFHDGTPFDAEAVKFSIERQINPEHPAAKLGKYPFANYFFGNVKAVEVVDPLTVQFVLKEPRASFLAVLTAGAASIVSPTAVKKFGADYALQRRLYLWAQKRGTPENDLEQLFQYPHGKDAQSGLIRHWPNHADHVHVRFKSHR